MKKYKIGNQVIYANSLHDALEVYKHKAKDEENVIYEVATAKVKGGRMDHEYFESKEELLAKYPGKDNGSVVKLQGFVGPFNNGMKNGKKVLRYEDRNASYMDSKMKDAGELQYPAVTSTHPSIISSTLNHIEEELKYAKVEGDKRGKTRVFRMLSEAREYYDRYKKECDNFEKFVKEYRKYLEDQYKRIMNLDAEATNFKGW